MKLTRVEFFPFSQSENIKADIRGGWCAGVTSLVSEAIGDYHAELGYASAEEWLEKYAFKEAKTTLQRINAETRTAESLQAMLGRIKDTADVCGQIHTKDFDGRGCKVLLSLAHWVPVIGWVSYLWKSVWDANHIGYIVRGGKKLLLFDPNFGVGLFAIEDDQPLTLYEVTKAIGELAWAYNKWIYPFCYTFATHVIDEDWGRARFSVEHNERLQALVEGTRNLSF